MKLFKYIMLQLEMQRTQQDVNKSSWQVITHPDGKTLYFNRERIKQERNFYGF